MDISPHPLKPDSKIVTFENAGERRRFGFNTPAFSMERFRTRFHQIPDLDAPISLLGESRQDRDNAFPYSVRVPDRVLGHVAGMLLTSKVIVPDAIRDNSQMLQTIMSYFENEQAQTAPAASSA